MSSPERPDEGGPPDNVHTDPGPHAAGHQAEVAARETCDVCGSTDLMEIRCKVVCRNCRTILRTCSDL